MRTTVRKLRLLVHEILSPADSDQKRASVDLPEVHDEIIGMLDPDFVVLDADDSDAIRDRDARTTGIVVGITQRVLRQWCGLPAPRSSERWEAIIKRFSPKGNGLVLGDEASHDSGWQLISEAREIVERAITDEFSSMLEDELGYTFKPGVGNQGDAWFRDGYECHVSFAAIENHHGSAMLVINIDMAQRGWWR